MAHVWRKTIRLHPCFDKNYIFVVYYAASIIQKTSFQSFCGKEYPYSSYFGKQHISEVQESSCIRHFSANTRPGRICWEVSSHSALLQKLELALKDNRLDEAWEAYRNFKSLYGLPNRSVVSRFITVLSYSYDPIWLRKAFDLVVLIQNEKQDLLHPDLLTKLSLSFARAKMPVPASQMLRLMLEKDFLLELDILGLVILHMVKTEIGTYLASNILFEICDYCQQSSPKKATSLKVKTPDTMIFNLVLAACVRFKSTFKAQQIIDLMSQVGVTGDAHSIIIISQIYEMNYQRDDLKKFKDCVDHISFSSVRHYGQFYDSLLSLHFKFNDFDNAAGLIMDIYKSRSSILEDVMREPQKKQFLVPIGSSNLPTGSKLKILPHLLQRDSILKVEGKEELVKHKNGRLTLSNKALAKLIVYYKRDERVSELSKLLNTIQRKLDPSKENGLCSDVIDACIQLGWLGTAHDILEDFESFGTPLGANSYASLLKAYHKGKMFREAEVLLKQSQKAGVVIPGLDETIASVCLLDAEDKSDSHPAAVNSLGISSLSESIVKEMTEAEKAKACVVHELNSSIRYFMNARMIPDALKTYRRMQEKKIQPPTLLTFIALVYGYSCLGMYREITILWGDIKRKIESGNLLVNRDLYEFLLLNFLRGGYFERVMEVISHMKENGMYVDKPFYMSEFLKFHRDLYKNLKASSARNEVQRKRLEHVRAFRKWIGVH